MSDEEKGGEPEIPENGDVLLDRARMLLTTYCAMPSPEAADAVVLWVAATHALPALPFAPRLSVRSATKRSGKSRVLEVVAALVHRPLKTVNATVPAIFRSLNEDHPPTLIFDEADTLFGSRKVAEQNEDLRGMLNAGFERGNPSIRCVGPLQIPTEFPSFAMAALAGIGSLPDTIEDRSVLVHMRRRKPSETVKPFRLRRDRPALEDVGTLLAGWLGEHRVRQQLEALEPASDLEDRQADVWESLLLVADVAGGEWPARARAAAKRLCDESAEDEHETSLPVQLLHDLAEVFGLIQGDFAPTEVILQNLKSVKDSPWSEMDLTGHRLARMLREFGIRSRHDAARTKRGYWRESLTDAWERYPVHRGANDSRSAGAGRIQAAQASEASTSVRTHGDQAKQPDALKDALTDTDKASGEVSTSSSRSAPVRTLADASDASPAANEPCDRCSATPTKTDRAGARYCETCAPHIWRTAS